MLVDTVTAGGDTTYAPAASTDDPKLHQVVE